MEQLIANGQSAQSWRDGFAQSVEDRRRVARERISEQRKRLQEFDSQLTAKLDEATAQLSAAQQAATSSTTGSNEREAALKEWQQRLDEQERQWEQKRAELEAEHKRLQASLQEQLELNRRQAETSREEAVRHAEQLEHARQESQAELERLRAAAVASKAGAVQALSGKFDPLFAKLSEHETLLSEINRLLEHQATQKSSTLPAETAAEMATLRQENKSLAARVKEAHSLHEQIGPLVTKLAEQEVTLGELSRKLDKHAAQTASSLSAEAAAELAALREENKALTARQEEMAALSKQIDPLLARLAEQDSTLGAMSRKLDEQAAQKASGHSTEAAAELAMLRGEIKELLARPSEAAAPSESLLTKLAEQEMVLSEMSRKLDEQAVRKSSSESSAALAEVAALREENRLLAARLTEAESMPRAGSGEGGGPDAEDLRRRFEMAVQDVRELKTKNADLAEQLANAKQTASGTGPAQAAGTGWEALKQKLMNELESDFDDNDPRQKEDKLTVQGAIKITDDVVAAKERELTELRRLLDTQAQQVGEMAVGAAAVAQLLDTDELVRQERESLARLQESLREQLKQAEIDSSLERAKLARERLELDEKIRVLEAEKAQLPASSGDATGEKGKSAKGRKWLTRLGLGDGKEE